MPPGNEQVLLVLVLLGFVATAIYLFVVWVMEAPRTADPWDKETELQLQDEHALPVCHHCFTPQQHSGWFCPECGATVGPYANYMPYIYVFSQGEVLRAGVTEPLRPTFLIVAGYVLLSLGTFAIAAPFYWFVLFRHLWQKRQPPEVQAA